MVRETDGRNGIVRTLRRYFRFNKPDSGEEFADDWDDTVEGLLILWTMGALIGVFIIGLHIYWRMALRIPCVRCPYWFWQIFVFLGAVLATVVILSVARDTHNAAENVGDGLDDLVDLLDDLTDSTSNALKTTELLRVAAAGCDDYLAQLDAVDSAVSVLDDDLTDSLEPVEDYQDDWESVTEYAPWGFAIFVLAPCLCTLCCLIFSRAFSYTEDCSYAWTIAVQIPVLLVLVMCGIVVSVGTADFCFLGPASVLSADDSKNDLMAYYLQCNGPNPLRYATGNATAAVDTLIETDWNGCPSEDLTDELEMTLKSDVDSVQTVTEGCSSENFGPVLTELVYDDVCDDGVRAMYLSYYALALFGLYILLFVYAPVFKKRWDEEDDDRDIEMKPNSPPLREESKEEETNDDEDNPYTDVDEDDNPYTEVDEDDNPYTEVDQPEAAGAAEAKYDSDDETKRNSYVMPTSDL